jgi:hypothetical protein
MGVKLWSVRQAEVKLVGFRSRRGREEGDQAGARTSQMCVTTSNKKKHITLKPNLNLSAKYQ